MSEAERAGAGRFLTLEGGEGAGKSTQARLLAAALRAEGAELVLTREPGGSPSAERLRAMLLDPAASWAPDTEILLHFAARAEHLARTIAPALARGATVVSDRFADSTMAYQGYGLAGDRALIAALTGLLPVRPDLTLVLEVGAATRQARVAKRGGVVDRYEAESEAFHARVAEGFSAIAEAQPARCVRIDAEGDAESVHAAIMAAVRGRWPMRGG